MKLFHISDVLSVTTGRLVSNRHMEGVYDILNFLTGDNLFTHQLPRAMVECEPWLRTQFPQLFADRLSDELARLDEKVKSPGGITTDGIAEWVASVQTGLGLPEMLPVYELGADMHTRIDPVEELCAMVGDEKVLIVDDCEC